MPSHARLYRNNGNGTFSDVTAGSGLDVAMYGMGGAAADYDNDGRVDVFITAVGGNHLFHNEGNGRFTDVTRRAGLAAPAVSTTPPSFHSPNPPHLPPLLAPH